MPIVQQARVLAQRYNVVVANPPYMGSKGMNKALKDFAKKAYPNSKSDLFAIFIERCIELAVHRGYAALVTIQNWMFLSSFEPLRKKLISESYISSLVQIGYNSFPELNSKVVQAAASVFVKEKNDNAIGCYVNVNNASQSADKKCEFLSRLMQGDIYLSLIHI